MGTCLYRNENNPLILQVVFSQCLPSPTSLMASICTVYLAGRVHSFGVLTGSLKQHHHSWFMIHDSPFFGAGMQEWCSRNYQITPWTTVDSQKVSSGIFDSSHHHSFIFSLQPASKTSRQKPSQWEYKFVVLVWSPCHKLRPRRMSVTCDCSEEIKFVYWIIVQHTILCNWTEYNRILEIWKKIQANVWAETHRPSCSLEKSSDHSLRHLLQCYSSMYHLRCSWMPIEKQRIPCRFLRFVYIRKDPLVVSIPYAPCIFINTSLMSGVNDGTKELNNKPQTRCHKPQPLVAALPPDGDHQTIPFRM